MKTSEYILISKTIFFPEKGILAIGDLHLGYEEMLRNQGIIIPFNQIKITKKEIQEIINKIKSQKYKLKKIILLGDLKHHFEYQKSEKFVVREFIEFLKKFVSEENIIIIKGNHDIIKVAGLKYHGFYIVDDIIFIHGHKNYEKIYDKKIKTIVMSHIHPAVLLKEKKGVKKEKYKCFLIGEFKKKNIIILPSFFPLVEGTEISEEFMYKEGWSIIPKKILLNLNAYIIGENKIYNFGKLKNLR